jgi:hypothetical protein
MADRHPALDRLDVLVGRWTVQLKVEGAPAAASEFAWQDGGLFLHQISEADLPDEGTPWPFPVTSVIGFDDASGEFTMLYADARGVHRVYRMTLIDGAWTIWREAPGFNQRFIGMLSPDQNSVDGRWEMSEDGVDWHVDFELTYTRER